MRFWLVINLLIDVLSGCRGLEYFWPWSEVVENRRVAEVSTRPLPVGVGRPAPTPSCLLRWKVMTESTVRWVVVREKHCLFTEKVRLIRQTNRLNIDLPSLGGVAVAGAQAEMPATARDRRWKSACARFCYTDETTSSKQRFHLHGRGVIDSLYLCVRFHQANDDLCKQHLPFLHVGYLDHKNCKTGFPKSFLRMFDTAF
jgi:hypothetical protein